MQPIFLSGILARGRKRVKERSLPALARGLPALAWMAGIFYLSSQSAPLGASPSSTGSIAAHVLLYGGLAFLLFWALDGGAPAWVPAWVAFAAAVLYGASDEVHQAFVAGRTASETDLALDAAGAALGVGAALLLPLLRRAARPLLRETP